MLRDFFKTKTGPQKLMLVAIALNFISQFFLYSDAPVAVPEYRMDQYGNFWRIILPEGYGRATGFDLHWHAWPILIGLALVFANDRYPHGPRMARFGWWGAALLLLAACLPTASGYWGFGTMWGLVSVVVALVAAFRNGHARRIAAQKGTA